ncbi:unnamed protein product [Alopecurus aequalis]
MAIFDKQDEEDDFTGVDESLRAEMVEVSREILRDLVMYRCLVVFHNGSNDTVEFTDFGIPQAELFGTKVLWTFRTRVLLGNGKNVDKSHLYIYKDYLRRPNWIFFYGKRLRKLLVARGGNIMDYKWVAHASNYWVCDGIIQEGGQFQKAWEDATALHQQLHLENYSSNTMPYFGSRLNTHPKRWIFATKSTMKDSVTLHRESTSFFLVDQNQSGPPLPSLPNDMFHHSNMLRVLRLCRCTFSFSSPPFHCCRSLRFLGLDLCKDQSQVEDEEKEIPEMKFFQSLWVVDICNTDWKWASSQEIMTKKMAANIREVNINKGQFLDHSFAWRRLQNLRKLRVIESTCPCKMREVDEFVDMVKLELLDLSNNSAIQVLPSLSGATSLKSLVLDGCVELEHVENLPPSLESFSLALVESKMNYKVAKITHISMANCARMVDFTLRGSFPILEELDLSSTKVKTLDLKDEVVQVPRLKRVMLLGCEQLRAIIWPRNPVPQLNMLCIDTRGGKAGRVQRDFMNLSEARAAMPDMRLIQSLVVGSYSGFFRMTDRLNLCISATSTGGGQRYNKEKLGPSSIRKAIGPGVPNTLIANASHRSYRDVTVDNITINHDYNNAPDIHPSAWHVEIGEGIINTSVESVRGIKSIIFVMNEALSLYVHDSSSITTVILEHMMSIEEDKLRWRRLKQCRVERCSKLQTVFITNYDINCFPELETFWAADLPMAHCIWSKGRTVNIRGTSTFVKLRSIHLYSCPRLEFVLPLSWLIHSLSSLETLHIVNCGDLRHVFPVEEEFLKELATSRPDDVVLEFPELKHIYLHELNKLQQICEAKMFAPKLETVRLRGCWGLRRLPSVGQYTRPIVNCERDWWEKLEWDGPAAGHDPSLFEVRHSSYYKKPLPRVSVLR